MFKIIHFFSPVVQLVERAAHNGVVVGSSPAGATKLIKIRTGYRSGERQRLLISYFTPWVRVPPGPPLLFLN